MSSLRDDLQNLPNDQAPNYATQGVLKAFAEAPSAAPFRHAVKPSYTHTEQPTATLWDAQDALSRRTTSPFARHF